MKRLVAFDLDGTLAESKQAIVAPMPELLAALLGVADVAVISGGDWPQFETQVVSRLPDGADLDRLWIMPTTGTKLYRHADGRWERVFADLFSDEERHAILAAIDAALTAEGLDEAKIWGERVEDRGSQITFSGLGQQAPLEAKSAWDPDRAKRRKLQARLVAALPDLSIAIGGATSVDITRKGIDKAYALDRLAEQSGIPIAAMLFLGDAMYEGGNDAPVRKTGIDSIAVRDPGDTAAAIRAIVACQRDISAP